MLMNNVPEKACYHSHFRDYAKLYFMYIKKMLTPFAFTWSTYYYKYQPPRPLEEIEAEIKVLEGEILEMLGEVAG